MPTRPCAEGPRYCRVVSQFLQHGRHEAPKRMQFLSWQQQLGISWVMGGDADLAPLKPACSQRVPKGTAFEELHALRMAGL